METKGIALISMALLAALPPGTVDAAPIDVRVMSFNIKQHAPANRLPAGDPTHWERRKPVALDAIRGASPDIVGLQEAYRGQIDDLREALPHFDEVGEGRRGESRDEHCTVLFRSDRFRPADSGTFWLSDTPGEPSATWGHFYPRICTWVRLVERGSGSALYVFNTHLDHQSQEAREKAVRLIARRIDERQPKDPFVLTGDFNAGEDNPVVIYLKGRHDDENPAPVVDSFRVLHPTEMDAGTGNRFEGRVDGPKIDYVFVPPEAEVIEAAIIRSQRAGVYASDHYPVTARIRLGGGGEAAARRAEAPPVREAGQVGGRDEVRGTVVDAAGSPVAGIRVSPFWISEDGVRWVTRTGKRTDAEGKFSFPVRHVGDRLMTLDASGEHGAVVTFDAQAAAGPLVLELRPTVLVRGEVTSEELGREVERAYVSFSPPGTKMAVASHRGAPAFGLRLPPGEYAMTTGGVDCQRRARNLAVGAREAVLDLGTIDLEATVIARHYGREPPPWNITAARGVSADATLADFEGRWVLIEFWGYW